MQGTGRKMGRMRKRRRAVRRAWTGILLGIFCITMLLVTGWQAARLLKSRKTGAVIKEIPIIKKVVADPPEYDVQLLSVNEYSRPGAPLEKVNGIVIHYTANPGTSAQQNRDYFEGLSQSGETYASSHFVIGIEGELIQCIPCNEIAYASNERNGDTISIECCIPDETGRFSDDAYNTLLHLTAWLMGRYGLEIDSVIRHYDVTGKACPKYYVEYPLEWEALKEDICQYIEQYGIEE